jgi:glucose/mannose-6-phosphate isomerase
VSRAGEAPGLELPFGARDAGGMAARIAAIPDDIEAALTRLAARPWRLPAGSPTLLAVGGMGGSAIAASLTAGAFAATLPRPLAVVREAVWPGWVAPGALALLSSCSGDTAETLALYDAAGVRGVPRLALTRGGELAARARRDGVFVAELPPGGPPRAALFSGWVPLTGLVHALGWNADPAPAWREAAAVVREQEGAIGAAVPEAANEAKRLARALHGRLPIVYAAGAGTGAVALRWRQQLHENAKLPGHSATAPELAHNEIVGWERPGPLENRAAVVMLLDDDDDPGARERLALAGEFARRRGATVHTLTPRGTGRLARLASLVHYGDTVSLYLAFLGGADPTPIASIDELKRRLAASGRAHGG